MNDGEKVLRLISNLIVCHISNNNNKKGEADFISSKMNKIMTVCTQDLKWPIYQKPWSLLMSMWEQCMKHVMGMGFIQDHIVSFHRNSKSYILLTKTINGCHVVDLDTTHLSNLIIEDLQKNTRRYDGSI